MARRVQVHGHRGARARRPENTMEAFRYAIQVGADFIEMDVHVTADGVPVIVHDPIPPLALAELRRLHPSIPTLEEVLDLSGIQFNIEIKRAPPETVLSAIRRRGLEPRVIVQSFDFRILEAMRKLAPEIRLAALDETGARDFVATAAGARAQIIAPEYRLVTPEKVRAAHAAGIQVIPWTANTAQAWARLVEAGVDAIITDDPAALIAWLEEHGAG